MATTTNVPLTERRYLAPFVLITSLFFLWAFGVNLNDVLIPHFKKAFQLTDLQSSLIQAAFFGGYFLAALPAGWLMERIGYKRGILTGLMICATGALLFIPSANALSYYFFLFALFVMACGQSFLEVAANPYVTILGPAESSERRLNLAQSFNSVGAVATPYIGAAFILTNTRPGAGAADEVQNVIGPYVVIAARLPVGCGDDRLHQAARDETGSVRSEPAGARDCETRFAYNIWSRASSRSLPMWAHRSASAASSSVSPNISRPECKTKTPPAISNTTGSAS